MRKLAVWLALLCLTGVSQAAITRVGSATASAATVTCPAHQAGDLILIQAVRGASTTAPTLPSGYHNVLTNSNATTTTVSQRIGYKIATGTSDASGTWTNANELICVIYRPSSGNTLRVGQNASSSSTNTNVAFPTLSPMGDAGGNSWVVGFVGASNITQTVTTAPSGMTNVTSVVGASYEAAVDDTNAGVTSWSSTNASMGTGHTVSATIEIVLAPTAAPSWWSTNIYQHVGGGSQPYVRYGAPTGNAYKIPLPLSSGAGNTIVLAITSDGAIAVSSVTGAVNGSFGSAAVSALGGTGNQDTYVYVLPNITAGKETITVTYASSTSAFQYCVTELYGVATTFTATAGTTTQKTAFSTTIGAGSFTPANNNATGGNFIWAYFVKAEQAPLGFTSALFPGASFGLMNADIAGNAADSYNMPKVVEGFLQATSAAINPTMVSAAESTDHWNSLAVALKISSGTGTAPPSGIQLQHIDHFATIDYPASGTYALQCPMFGNLRVISTPDGNISSSTVVRDSEGNTWTNDGTGIPGASFWYFPNASADPNLLVFIDGGGTDNGLSWRCRDIYGAATSPFDSAVKTADVIGSTQTVYTPSTLPSPTNTNGLVVADIGLGLGPGLAVTAPTGSTWDFVTYTGEVDQDMTENADIGAHYSNTASGSETWTFTVTANAGNGSSGGFISFKAPPPPSVPPSQFFFGALPPPSLHSFPRQTVANDEHFKMAAGY